MLQLLIRWFLSTATVSNLLAELRGMGVRPTLVDMYAEHVANIKAFPAPEFNEDVFNRFAINVGFDVKASLEHIHRVLMDATTTLTGHGVADLEDYLCDGLDVALRLGNVTGPAQKSSEDTVRESLNTIEARCNMVRKAMLQWDEIDHKAKTQLIRLVDNASSMRPACLATSAAARQISDRSVRNVEVEPGDNNEHGPKQTQCIDQHRPSRHRRGP